MTRQVGPDEASRLVYLKQAGTIRAQGLTGRLFANEAGSLPADVLTELGAIIPIVSGAAQVDIDENSQWPIVQYPDGVDTIYGSVNGGPIVPLPARVDDRLDALAARLSSLVLNVRDYGAVGDGTTNDTAAINAAIAAVPASGGTVYLPAGRYAVTTLTVGAKNLQLVGDAPRFRGQVPFGNAQYADLTRFAGTWIVSSATSGSVITLGNGATPYPSVAIERIGIVGPGTGTSTGLTVDDVVAPTIVDLKILNFAVGFSGNFIQDALLVNLNVWGCQTGLYMTGSNQNAFVNTFLQFNQNYAIKLENCSVNLFSGGCTEANNGTVILLDLLTSVTVFDGFYFEDVQSTWPQPVTYAFDITAGCDFNGFRSCHWPSGTYTGRIRGNHTQVLFPQGSIALDLASSFSGFYFGYFPAGISYTANTAVNTIINMAGGGSVVLPNDIFMPPGKKLYLGPATSYGNWIQRNAATGDTEISSASTIVKLLANAQAPAFAPSGLTGATSPTRFVGGTASGAPATGTFAVGDYVVTATGRVLVCTTAGTSGTWADASGWEATATLDFPSITAGSATELTVAVTGAATGSVVMLGPPAALEAGLVATGYVSSANTVTIRLHNFTGGAIDPASATWKVRVGK